MTEPATSLLQQGLSLMITGMGVVFVFLFLLVWATKLMSWLVNALLPAANLVSAAAHKSAAAHQNTLVPTRDADKRRIVAVITAALAHHQEQPRLDSPKDSND